MTIPREELNKMQNCVNCQRKIILKVILTVLNLKPSEIARGLNISKSLVSKYISGERTSVDLDLYLIERIFSIQVKDYTRNDTD